jgi:L,D-transpeptidase ErfK/SrfK
VQEHLPVVGHDPNLPASAVPVPSPDLSPPTGIPVKTDQVSQRTGMLVGGDLSYVIKKRETLQLLSSKFGVSSRYLAKLNGLDLNKPLKAGQKIIIPTRRIIPKVLKDGIVINIPDRTLYHFRRGELAAAVPIAVGKPRKKDRPGWETPTGTFTIKAKISDPAWHVPPSIQKEMEEQGKEVLTEVPPGPGNPLGKYALKTSLSGILIHSTNLPASIYSYSSHGCIRVFPSKMEELFRQVAVNSPGEIIYQPIKAMRTEEGRIFLEVHRDVYGKIKDPEQAVLELLRKLKFEDQVDWDKIGLVVKEKSGVAEDVSL